MKKSLKLIHSVSIGIVLMLWSLLSSAGSVALAQDISLTLPDTSGIAGDTLRVPLRVSPLQLTDAVTAGEFNLSYNSGIVDLVGYETQNTLLENHGSILLNQSGDQLAFAGTDTVTGSGTLITLNFLIHPSATYNQRSDLNFSSAQLNEGSPTTGTTNGRIRVQGIYISPRSSYTQVINGDSLQFSLSGDIHPPVTWQVSDTSLASIDANGWLKAKKPGLIRVKAEDNVGLADSTDRFRIQAATLASLSLSIPDVSARQTLEVDVPVQVSDVTGLNITSSEVTISYDTRYLEYLYIDNAGTMTEPWGNLTVNSSGSGTLTVAGAGIDTLSGVGTLFTIRYKVKHQYTGNSTIAIAESIFNETINATNINGTFTVLPSPSIEINYSDTTLSVGDQLTFSVTGGEGTTPYTWASSDVNVASIDASTGALVANQRGDALITATDDEGFPSDQINVRVNDFDAYLDTIAVNYPDTAVVTLQAGDFTGKGVLSYEMTMQYDTSKIRFLSVESANTLSENLSVQVRDHADTLELAVAGTSELTGIDPLVRLKFTLNENVSDGDFAPLNLLILQFNEPGEDTPTATIFPGGIEVIRTQPAAMPSLLTPADQATDQPIDVPLTWSEAAGADTYRLQVAPNDQFTSTIVDSSGITNTSFVASDFLQYDSTYYWRVLSVNSGGSSSFSAPFSFTVITSAPRLANPLADQVAIEGEVFSFQVPANTFADADDAGLSLSANLENGDPLPSWLTFDTGNVTFSGTPGNTDTGVIATKVIAEDQDGATVTDVFELEVTDQNFSPVLISDITDFAIDEDNGPYLLSEDLNTVFQDTMDYDPLTFSVTVTGQGVTANISNDSLIIEPAPNYFGVDTLTVNASDGEISNSTEVIVTVNSINDQPVFTALPDTISFAVDTSANLLLFNYMSDIETAVENLAVDIVLSESNLSHNYYPSSGLLQISSNGFTGFAQLHLTVTDEDGGFVQDSLWLAVTTDPVINPGPVLMSPVDDLTLDEDSGPYVVSVDLNTVFQDTVEHNPLTFDATVTGQGITAAITNDSLVIDLALNYHAVDTLTITAYDGLLSNSTEVIITINPINDLPEFTALPDSLTFDVDSTATLQLFNYMSDVETVNENLEMEFASDESALSFDYDTLSGILQVTSAGYTGTTELRLTATDEDGGSVQDTIWLKITTTVDIEDQNAAVPVKFELQQNYPNPFNPSTTILYALPEEGQVRLEVFNLVGSSVAVLVNDKQPGGTYSVRFDATGLSSGIYYYRLKAGNSEQIRKMTLLK